MSKCTCNEEDYEPHPCPYSEEIGNYTQDEEEYCKCCPECEHQCCMDI